MRVCCADHLAAKQVSYQAEFILSTYSLPRDEVVSRYIEVTTRWDDWWRYQHEKIHGPEDMLSCAQTGGSWGNNFRRRRRQGAIGETEARQLALISKFGLCCPTDMTLDDPLPTAPEEWFQEQHLPHALAIRVGFLQPHMHAALGLPHACSLKQPDMRRGYGTLLAGQARAQAALKAEYVAEFFERAPAPPPRGERPAWRGRPHADSLARTTSPHLSPLAAREGGLLV